MSASGKPPEFPTWPQFDDDERTGLIRALEQGQWWRMGGNEVNQFEQEFARYHGTEYALALTNGTHALELALQLLGVGPGTEVIVPAFTFISSSQAAQRIGAVAVPVDVDLETYCVDPAAVERAIGPKTKAIMPVHMAGHVADMDSLTKLSADSGVPLLHDAAHAHGAQWHGRRVGELGSLAAFSFQNGKLMTAGEGGALTFPDAATHEEGFLRHSCGRPPTDRGYFHQTSGSNFRMNEFSAAVLRAQLRRLDGQIELREQRAPLLSRILGEIDGVVPQGRDERCDRNPHYMMMFRIPGITEQRRNIVVDALIERGVPAFAAFRAIYRCPGFWETGGPELSVDELARRCPNTEALYTDCIWLHHRTLLGTEEQMYQIGEIVSDVLGVA
ncbi:DegT/DnrJ/EryC1/StrS family aminotransferase [Micromonospora cathayae]|uniref:DegT/DnrJ/EryC1/StrS family aminotransferase n=1 Tax=Micromonospora cathayae TaxID=3028804 RepID=A0ABY7ZU46_9ACTN|nr:DegT/DnrJ/EryC1/StrS family aminotransferase [Micromonospora sp. HUAS 3]WDZ86555.1 DegT/DnrJ/EryC1/StrS family aminotransferase [Micromonospora sp. HUAS 3]